MNSTHKVEVVPVVLTPHPNADSLSIVNVYSYTVCVRTADWQDKSIGAFLPPDSIVPDKPEYAFLSGHLRIKAKRLRGVKSFGLLVPAPEGAQIGDDVAEALGVTHYDPPEPNVGTGGEAEKAPGDYPVYDVEALRRYPDVIQPGELVDVTEKIHGANGRFMFKDGRFWCGSRTEWKRPPEEGQTPNIWWKALENTPALKPYLSEHPGVCVYGEVYGQVQDLKYQGGLNIAVFDAWKDGVWWVPNNAAMEYGFALVPLLFSGPFDLEAVLALAEGKTTVPGAKNVREGCVVRPVQDRRSSTGDRVIFKAVGVGYLERA